MVFFSYRTKRESPADDQFWKFSHQCSIFGRIGDQWVAISSPVLYYPSPPSHCCEGAVVCAVLEIKKSTFFCRERGRGNVSNTLENQVLRRSVSALLLLIVGVHKGVPVNCWGNETEQ